MPPPRTKLLSFALLTISVTGTLTAQKVKWPPDGPTWETVPARAVAKARAERKAVMAYVANEGCPHCVVMARDTWPTEEVKAVQDEVVFLAVHRDDDVDWTTRLNVIAYPQTLFLDGWGKILPGGRDHVFVRDKHELVAAVKAFAGKRVTKARPPALPAKLRAAVPKRLVEMVLSPDCDLRIAAWRRVMPRFTPAQLALLFAHESDPVARLEALRAMPSGGASPSPSMRLATAGLRDANDYVRQDAIELLAELGGPDAGLALAGVIDSVLDGSSGYANPNNVLCAATKAAASVADPCMVDALAQILRQEKANNSGTHLAVAALVAIGDKHGSNEVRPALELALSVEGAGANRLHAAAKAALRD